jgi:hypothetical protein
MVRKTCFGLCILGVIAIGVPRSEAQEPEAPAADAADTGSGDPYFDLRKSKDRVTRQWAERYFNLVKFQEWSSDKGKTIKAKYVSHQPDLSSVTLLVVRGSGASRTEQEVAVKVAQLSKSGQSRVKQIDITQKKLDELIAAGATAGESGQTPGQPAVSPGTPMIDEQGAEPAPRRTATRTRATRVRDTATSPAAPAGRTVKAHSVADDGNPDPLGFAELAPPSGQPATPAAGLPAAERPRGQK